MTIKWKAAVAGGSILGLGFGGFVAADEGEPQTPGDQILQSSASAGSSPGAPVRPKYKGGSWYPQLAGSDGVMSVSVASPFSVNNPGSVGSPASPGSIDSPASPNSGGGGASASGGGGASANSPAGPPSGGGGGSASGGASANSPAAPPSGGGGSASGGSGGGSGGS